jgi:alkylation response protein AidB-like acyl-CoA dehydrogenase
MFLVPKFLLDETGSPGEPNDIKVVSLEHKLGIHASPTCVLSYGDEGRGAVGYLVGEEHQGMRNMFTMMNLARVGVGMEGVAIGERAYQQALGYARERVQGREIGADSKDSVAIVEHPDVRRMLLTIKANVEWRWRRWGCRCTVAWATSRRPAPPSYSATRGSPRYTRGQTGSRPWTSSCARCPSMVGRWSPP